MYAKLCITVKLSHYTCKFYNGGLYKVVYSNCILQLKHPLERSGRLGNHFPSKIITRVIT